jgi:hypothetical protein
LLGPGRRLVPSILREPLATTNRLLAVLEAANAAAATVGALERAGLADAEALVGPAGGCSADRPSTPRPQPRSPALTDHPVETLSTARATVGVQNPCP